MPSRKEILANGEYYHVFNRAENKRPIFSKTADCNRAIGLLEYYRFAETPMRFSYLMSYGLDKRANILKRVNTKDLLITVISFSLMPNHFHLLLRQEKSGGISRYLAQFQNSYTKYLNTKNLKDGHTFKGQFKAVRIEDGEQLQHIVRYIHINPLTSFVVKDFEDLEKYPYSSLQEYLGLRKGFCDKAIILSNFKSKKSYRDFLFDQVGYQQELDYIKHLLIEKI